MDWLIDTGDTRSGSAQALALLEEHLQRHAVDPGSVQPALAALPGHLDHAVRSADGRPLHLQLDWTAPRPVLDVAVLEQADADVPTGQPVSARHRARVRSWPRHHVARAEISLDRRSQETFAAGPPPLVEDVLDPEKHGPATVALALVTALEAHPTSSAPQAAAIAGSLIANAGTAPGELTDAQSAADAFVRIHHALGSEAYVVEAGEDRVELAVTRCPFGAVDGPAASLCHVTSGLADQLSEGSSNSHKYCSTSRSSPRPQVQPPGPSPDQNRHQRGSEGLLRRPHHPDHRHRAALRPVGHASARERQRTSTSARSRPERLRLRIFDDVDDVRLAPITEAYRRRDRPVPARPTPTT